MSDDPMCPTCGSDVVPPLIRVAMESLEEADDLVVSAVVLILQRLNLYGSECWDEDARMNPMETAAIDVLKGLSLASWHALDRHGPEPVYLFLKMRYGEPGHE